tara:strand:- start:7646 stop:8173 length:528 start_codon:yes stop_codon:yes gene_type:complete
VKRIRESAAQKQGLDDLIETLPPGQRKSMVEVGSFSGEGTSIFAKKIGFVIAVDPYQAYWGDDEEHTQYEIEEAKEAMDLAMKQHYNISLLRMKGKDACTFIRPVVNLVYLDAAFTQIGATTMIRQWKDHCRFIGGHDYDMEGVKAAVDAFACVNQLPPPQTFQDTSWLIDQHDK